MSVFIQHALLSDGNLCLLSTLKVIFICITSLLATILGTLTRSSHDRTLCATFVSYEYVRTIHKQTLNWLLATIMSIHKVEYIHHLVRFAMYIKDQDSNQLLKHE